MKPTVNTKLIMTALILTTTAVSSVIAQGQTVQGLIAERYNQLGGARGVLGRPLTNELPTKDGKGRYNRFENGMIAWSPNTGPKSIQIVYRSGNRVVFQWGPTNPFNYDKFIVRWTVNNGEACQRDIRGRAGSRTEGSFVINNANPNSRYAFVVEGADDGTFHSVARQGWSTWVSVGNPSAPAPAVQPPSLSVSSSGNGASSVFMVTGSGFQPGSVVTVRVVDDALHTLNYRQSATAGGQLNFRQAIPCNSGLGMHFSATDGRANPKDVTGSLWSNTFTIACP